MTRKYIRKQPFSYENERISNILRISKKSVSYAYTERIYMDINLELYKVFYYVAATLSFSEASRKLFISQSAVSQSIKTLEAKLHHTLFIRSTKKVSLTPEGELLLQHVKPALQMLDEGESLLSGEKMLQGQLRIGASDTICRYFLIDYLRRFHMAYPDVGIKVINSTSIGCVELLEKGQADFIVCNYPNSHLNSNARIRTVKEFEDVFVANPEYFPIGGPSIDLEELLKHPLLMLSAQSTTSEFLHRHFLTKGLKLSPEVELSSNDLLVDLARIGLGVACVPDYMLTDMNSLVRVNLKTSLPRRRVVLVRSDTLPASQAAERFLEIM